MAGDAERQRLLAPAKLTLTLRVTGRRADGYHLLDAEMVTLDLADELEIGPGDRLEVVTEPMGEAGPSGRAGVGGEAGPGKHPSLVPVGEDNLVRRALQAVGRKAAVTLTKRIPVGGGLGGGSADAAAVLRWAGTPGAPGAGGDAEEAGGRACSTPVTRARLALAARLGADVPFCLVGGRARVTGVGEVVEPLAPRSMAFVLLLPPLSVSTVAVYQAWDRLGGAAASGPNDLEGAAVAVEPRLLAWRDALARATGTRPVLAGSGSTWFVEGTPEQLGLAGRTTLSVDGETARLVAVRTAT
ncbi:MAG: 4-(cytidine 5'-diphospho)-2-C-methyl-D-erythritol kinase [Acidimicrobiales bacterium]